jgi:hypothetical protein
MRKSIRDLFAAQQLAQVEADRARAALLSEGPPYPWITAASWETWCLRGWFRCPGAQHGGCQKESCAVGLLCKRMARRGLLGDGQPIRKSDRIKCGARTRRGGLCQMVVVAGMARCRLHGGLSTGPKTAEGRARIAEAQRRRWQKLRTHGPSAPPTVVLHEPAPAPVAGADHRPPADPQQPDMACQPPQQPEGQEQSLPERSMQRVRHWRRTKYPSGMAV